MKTPAGTTAAVIVACGVDSDCRLSQGVAAAAASSVRLNIPTIIDLLVRFAEEQYAALHGAACVGIMAETCSPAGMMPDTIKSAVKKSTIGIGAVMFSAPFLLLACAYNGLPAELPVMRSAFPGTVLVAAKSPFIVFRVPLMNLTHGLMAAIMLSRASDFEDETRRASYSALFSTLLFAIALKSDFEVLELMATGIPVRPLAQWAAAGTILSVLGGLMLALFRSRKVPIPWRELRMTVRDKVALATLFTMYVAVVAQSFLVGHRA